jgi:hypothetical protein
MSEPATRNAHFHFTRKRFIVVALVLVAVLAVLGFVFGVFDAEEPVKVTFIGFTNSAEGKFNLAKIELKSASRQIAYWPAIDPGLGVPVFDLDAPWIIARFRSRSATGEVIWESGFWRPNPTATFAPPADAELPAYIELPTDGRTGRVEVFYWHVKPAWSVDSWKPSGRRANPLSGSYLGRWAVCDQVIQCPRMRPDGTVEPARLVQRGEKER